MRLFIRIVMIALLVSGLTAIPASAQGHHPQVGPPMHPSLPQNPGDPGYDDAFGNPPPPDFDAQPILQDRPAFEQDSYINADHAWNVVATGFSVGLLGGVLLAVLSLLWHRKRKKVAMVGWYTFVTWNAIGVALVLGILVAFGLSELYEYIIQP